MTAGHPLLSFDPSKILITGASGELGAALARHYSAPGRTLSLWGRNSEKLDAVAASCRAAGAVAATRPLDLTDPPGAVAAIIAEDEEQPIDLLLLVAGLGDIQAPGDPAEDPAQVVRLGLVNFVAPCAMASAVARRMAARGEGCIVLIGSAAAFHPLPFAAGYASTKAGLARFADALRIGMAGHGVTITLVSPGFIDTAAGRKIDGPKPLLKQPDDIAQRIAGAVERKQAHLIVPWPFAVLRWLKAILPRSLYDRLLLSLAPPIR